MLAFQSPLIDITNVQLPLNQVSQKGNHFNTFINSGPKIRRHDPYGWKCLLDEDYTESIFSIDPAQNTYISNTKKQLQGKDHQGSPMSPGSGICNVMVQFKCHQSIYSSHILLEKGLYVVVQGDRGIDIGVVIGVNQEESKMFVEHTRPVESFLRYATQREVDYWATDLKEAEASAMELCQKQVNFHGINMLITQCEYQYDKKKLTFYYEASQRVYFVQLLKELYKKFGCRIWMEKVSPRD
ncbi:unnamed protein product [Phytomonas sp. Hart1]|nr:unnamed protein product [Phytomonas sp. Hart1]|eukprot:CCW70117.1 unnamed protein product [Phytomonas sp. isolate Hart1]